MQNSEVHNLKLFTITISSTIFLRGVRMAKHKARIRKKQNEERILIEYPESKSQPGRRMRL